jgi:hypothetical protein
MPLASKLKVSPACPPERRRQMCHISCAIYRRKLFEGGGTIVEFSCSALAEARRFKWMFLPQNARAQLVTRR